MIRYQIIGTNKGEVVIKATFDALNDYIAIKKFVNELANVIEVEEGDSFTLESIEDKRIISYINYWRN